MRDPIELADDKVLLNHIVAIESATYHAHDARDTDDRNALRRALEEIEEAAREARQKLA